MHAVINRDVLHQYHHLLRKSRLIKWMCMLYSYKLIFFIYVFLSVKIPLVDLHCLTIVCLCQVIFSALVIVEELHFSVLSLFKITMSASKC